MTLPISTLTTVSIFGIYFIYTIEKHNKHLKSIKKLIDDLKISIKEFEEIHSNVAYELHMYKPTIKTPSENKNPKNVLNISQDELIKLENELIKSHNDYKNFEEIMAKRLYSEEYAKEVINDDWSRGGRRYAEHANLAKIFLINFEKLQDAIYKKFLYFNEDIINGSNEIDFDEFRSWRKGSLAFYREIERLYTGIEEIVNDSPRIYGSCWQDYHPKLNIINTIPFEIFYEKFFTKLDEIYKTNYYINNEIKNYYKNWFNALLDSKKAKIFVTLDVAIILFLGIIIPLYMLQPSNLGFLTCEDTFYILSITIFILILLIFPLLAYAILTKSRD
jgi:hypothetical protein